MAGRWRWAAGAAAAGGLALVALLDHWVGASLPASHLYYLPIALAALVFGHTGGAVAAGSAVALYNLTHFVPGGASGGVPAPGFHLEGDVLRLALFLAVGLVTAQIAADRRTLRRQAAQLREQNAALEALSAARADFVAAASHELRTPLTVIVGSAEQLSDPSDRVRVDAAGRARVLARLRHAARRLEWTVETLLDSALSESGRLALRPEAVPLDQVLEEARGMVTGAGTGVPEDRVLLPAGAAALSVLADRNRLLQVLINLLSNAVKYSPEETPIEIRVRSSGANVEVSVVDSGYGILPDELPRVFDRYYRVADGRVRAARGAGIGLSIGREIARAQGGDLTVESVPEKGSTFTLTLPTAPASVGATECLPDPARPLAQTPAFGS